ncbi:MAG: hypothetical protein M1839_005015 [Geoglossum umbratile]|nr:MAG: hypothetical protein M1839_005015 [Geoglossum umbratile]
MSSHLDEETPGQEVDDLGDDKSPPATSDRNLSRLFDLPRVFCSPDHVQVDICDIAATTGNKWHTLKNDKELGEHIHNSNPDVRIISIISDRTDKPLRITKSSAKAIFDRYTIGPEISDIFCSFGRKPRKSEAGLGSMKAKYTADGSCDMQYLLGYIEETDRPGDKWVMRLVGVFHRFVPNGPGSLWIFLHAYPNTRVMERVKASIPDRSLRQQHWSFIHSLVLSTCLENWRWYLRSLNDEFEEISNLMLTHEFSSSKNLGDPLVKDPLSVLTPLRFLGDKALSLATQLRSSIATVRKLREASKTLHNQGDFAGSDTVFQRICDETINCEIELEGHLEDVKLLQERARETLGLVSLALNLQNQAMVVNINQGILSLTQDTVDDSATVRVVTIVTLIYVPASFVSSILGMNLFAFQGPSGGGFTVSRQFWVFIALTVPLMILTVGSWYLFTNKRKKEKERQPPATAIANVTVNVDEETGNLGAVAEAKAGALARILYRAPARRRVTA